MCEISGPDPCKVTGSGTGCQSGTLMKLRYPQGSGPCCQSI